MIYILVQVYFICLFVDLENEDPDPSFQNNL